MQIITHELETKRNGIKIVKIYFLCDQPQPILKNAQKEFTKEQRKEAKLNHKNSLKNLVLYNSKREELVAHFIKQPFPNWNLKFNLLKQ